MVLWGVIWGAIIGYLTVQYDEGLGLFAGAILGAIAGWTLRRAVRSEMAAQRQSATAAPAVQPPEQVDTVPPFVPATASNALLDPNEPDEFLDAVDTVPTPAPAMARSQVVDLPEAREWGAQPPDVLMRLVDQAKAWLLGGNTIVRAGVLVLFVGLAFLAKFAVDNALLPPELRLAAIGAAGIALFVFGFRLRGRQPEKLAYALTLQGAGVGVLYLTVFAAFRLYQFLPASAAFGVLALVCVFSTAIALMQNAMPMAFIGFAGAFAAPILVSTGQGNHVGLFSYYLVLNLAIVAVAWLRAWRPLNLLGFFATFGVATAWGALKYQPEYFATTEPFLLAFFAIYLLASLLYATRHSLAPKQAVDATLVFGTPLVAFGLQAALVRHMEYATAFSSLALGALYLALGWWAVKREGANKEVGQWLAECFAVLGLGFVTLAVPLALDARWTSAVWAAEGAAVYWMGQRQGRWLARLAGLVLQVLAAGSYLQGLDEMQASVWFIANPAFIGATLLAVSALALAHWTRFATESVQTGSGASWLLAKVEQQISPVLFWVGFAWWQFALVHDIERAVQNADGNWGAVLSKNMQSHLEMLGWLVSAWVAHRLALPTRTKPWAVAATPAWFSLPIMVLFALDDIVSLDHVFQAWGWLVWPVALVLHFATLRNLDALAPRTWWSAVHTGGVWLVALLVGNLLVWAVEQAQLQGTSWAAVIFLVASVLVLLVLCTRSLYDAGSRVRQAWPLDRFAIAYLWRAAAPLAVAVGLGALLVAVSSNGNARPLPYVPLLNPTDITVALALLACALWLTRVRQSDLAVPAWVGHARWTLVLAGLGFIALNTVWLRVAHHYAGVPWDAERLFESFLVQAGYSILWTLLALGLMLVAHRRHARPVWMAGAALLGLTVAKLFLVDLSNRGGSERIVAFIAVGVMMLVVGYFAPIPPAQTAPQEEEGVA
ncbi:DUF2339 domain-containing protein [Rhodoferax saidenbachensis]|uniref:Membrane protein n=1 Tax=Rhodoferax saidenbachensis TaxID=1484693 RepID=A0ABU1ZPY7_9BURK|nr:DUF2339 domain-containing protein [Rhodoferax saidenbachensis]MDR7307618.1 putative membrane protein [Rhodoferax saidenbachensis]